MQVRLHEVAHSRAGDKGTLVTLSLIPYRRHTYPELLREVTAERVREHLSHRISGTVTRHEMPNLPGLLFVCERSPRDTVTSSLYLDAHSKSLSSALLEMTVGIDL